MQTRWLVLLCAHAALGCAASAPKTAYQTVPHDRLGRTAPIEANERGVSLAQQRKYAEAEAAFREALQADIGYPAAHNNLGLTLLHQGRLYEAAMEFQLASKLDRRAIEPIVNLGRLYESIGWPREAREQFERAVAIEATYTIAEDTEGERSPPKQN